MKSVIDINKAHVIMMMEQGIIDWSDGVSLLHALNGLKLEEKPGHLIEDIHMAVEEGVFKSVGPNIGGNLHIGKSRNDQVSTAIRMELRKDLIELMTQTVILQEALIELAEKHLETIIPGYTHLQPAQPVTLAHFLLSYVDMLERDLQRLREGYQRVNLCPMGAGALATSSFPINRERVADLLGFDGLLENSIDAVGSRDFILETLAALTILAVDLSRLTEDLILWSSPEFGIVKLPDGFSSTSSIMPQKKNPDVLEVIRARMAHVIGNFVTSTTILRTLPSSYNLDLQEVTPQLWESLEKMSHALSMLSKLVKNLRVNKDCFDKPAYSFLTSTELANMLVRKHGVPFRTAHKIVGALVKCLIKEGLSLFNATPELLQKVAKEVSSLTLNVRIEDIRTAVDPSSFIRAHKVRGGPSPTEVERMIRTRKRRIVFSRAYLSERASQLDEASERLQSVTNAYSCVNEIPMASKAPHQGVG